MSQYLHFFHHGGELQVIGGQFNAAVPIVSTVKIKLEDTNVVTLRRYF